MTCGEEFTCILTQDGGVFSFGSGMYGQLGHNSFENQYLPRKIFDLMGSEVTQIVCGRCHTLAYIAATNRLYSFGLSTNGQLGIAVTNVNKLTPTVVNAIQLEKITEKPKKPNEKLKFLHSVYCGGDQSFVMYKYVCLSSGKNFEMNFSFFPSLKEPTQLDYRETLNERKIYSINEENFSNIVAVSTNTIEKKFESNR